MNSQTLYGIVIEEIDVDGTVTKRESMCIDAEELIELRTALAYVDNRPYRPASLSKLSHMLFGMLHKLG